MKVLRYILPLFLLLKWGKLGITLGTMLLSFVVYTQIWGWRFAAGFLILLLIHELGHFVAAKERGLDVGAPTFIPFMGAWIQLKDQPMDVETEAHVALGGPLLGTIAAFAAYLLAGITDERWILAVAYSGLFLNLFNLIPVSPLDGGRIASILTPRIWFFGAPILVGLFAWRPSPILAILMILAVPQLIRAWRYDPADPVHAAYYAVAPGKRAEYAALYLGLVGLLAVTTFHVWKLLETH